MGVRGAVALSGEEAWKAVPTAGKEQVQPAGIDLRVAEVEVLSGEGVLGVGGKLIPPGRSVGAEGGYWSLKPGAYRVRFLDIVEVPADSVGLCYPRSSLLRMGAFLGCAVWDPGYKGRGQALLAVFNEQGLKLEVGTRIAQIVFVRLEKAPPSLYKGSYQGEGL
ncbi:MAG: deoxyuridine 5'-triphosphate nucleotidohydrolase [Desulfurococcales archaeon]|nr:deoxyuridine 5'-triphosphate nucleotidohydrolase [Desulfurococcales archaeon]